MEGKSIAQVTIEPDLPTEQIMKIHSDYLTLQRTSMIVSILNKHRESNKTKGTKGCDVFVLTILSYCPPFCFPFFNGGSNSRINIKNSS
ncbi:MAG: hypothetical protein H0U27_07080 [Nitrosopumilus sp.]|nr:hypothetical protein [Nitrosopumilus sp.]